MALTETRPATDPAGSVADETRNGPSQLEELIGSGDHLTIGRLYIGFALMFMALASAGLALAGIDSVSEEGLLGLTDALWSSSLVALVMMGALPLLLGLAVYIVPRQVGSAAIAFPRAAALSLWSWVIASGIFAVGVALGGGVSGTDLEGAQLSSLSLGVMMAALSLGAICVATTVLSHRPIGMGLSKVPFFAWSMLVATPVWILTFGSTGAHIFLARISDADALGLADAWANGIAWFLRVPSVYMLAIPALGIAADVVAKVAGRRIRQYGMVQGLIAAYAVLSFGAWTQSPRAMQTFLWIGWVLLAAVPVVALLGVLGQTLRRGSASAVTSLIGSFLVFLLILGGVLAGALQALDTAGNSGRIAVSASEGCPKFTIDVTGYSSTTGELSDVTSTRVFDNTESDACAETAEVAVAPGADSGVPDDAAAVRVVMTVVGADASGELAVRPAGSSVDDVEDEAKLGYTRGGTAAGTVMTEVSTGYLFGFDTMALEWAQGFFLFGAATIGALAGLAHWSRRIFGAPAPEGQGKGAVTAVLLGSGLLATAYLAEGLAGANEQSLSTELFGALVAIGGALVLLGAVAGLAMTLSAARVGFDAPDADDAAGLTLEWAPAGLPVAGVEQEFAYVNSPYPLLDLRGDDDEERS